MSSNAPHSSMRRYVIAAVAAIGCLLPAACDVAAASPAYNADRPGQGQQGDGRHDRSAPSRPAPTAPAPMSAGANGGASGSAAPANDQNNQGQNGNDQGAGDPASTRPSWTTRRRRRDGLRRPLGQADRDGRPDRGAARGGRHQARTDILARDCSKSNLAPHDGFQKAPAASRTAVR